MELGLVQEQNNASSSSSLSLASNKEGFLICSVPLTFPTGLTMVDANISSVSSSSGASSKSEGAYLGLVGAAIVDTDADCCLLLLYKDIVLMILEPCLWGFCLVLSAARINTSISSSSSSLSSNNDGVLNDF